MEKTATKSGPLTLPGNRSLRTWMATAWWRFWLLATTGFCGSSGVARDDESITGSDDVHPLRLRLQSFGGRCGAVRIHAADRPLGRLRRPRLFVFCRRREAGGRASGLLRRAFLESCGHSARRRLSRASSRSRPPGVRRVVRAAEWRVASPRREGGRAHECEIPRRRSRKPGRPAWLLSLLPRSVG